MSVLLQILAAVGALGGWILALTQLHRQHSRQARELSDLRDRIAARERAITKILGRYREAHRQLVLQLAIVTQRNVLPSVVAVIGSFPISL